MFYQYSKMNIGTLHGSRILSIDILYSFQGSIIQFYFCRVQRGLKLMLGGGSDDYGSYEGSRQAKGKRWPACYLKQPGALSVAMMFVIAALLLYEAAS